MRHPQFPLSVPEWLTRLHDNALQAIPTRFLPESVSPARPQRASADNQTHPCHMQTAANEAVTLHSAALPDLVCKLLELGSLDSALMPRLYQPAPNSPDSFCTVTALQSVSPNANSMAVVCAKKP